MFSNAKLPFLGCITCALKAQVNMTLILKLFVITIVFTILSLRERVSLCFPYVIIADRIKRCIINRGMYVKKLLI